MFARCGRRQEKGGRACDWPVAREPFCRCARFLPRAGVERPGGWDGLRGWYAQFSHLPTRPSTTIHYRCAFALGAKLAEGRRWLRSACTMSCHAEDTWVIIPRPLAVCRTGSSIGAPTRSSVSPGIGITLTPRCESPWKTNEGEKGKPPEGGTGRRGTVWTRLVLDPPPDPTTLVN
jgi:hypothetical protein